MSRRQEKRTKILEAAQGLFLANGFASTSTDAITAAAGVSKQTVYSYFPSKGALFTAVLRHLIDEKADETTFETSSGVSLQTRQDLRNALMELAGYIIEKLMDPEYLAMIRMVFAELRQFPELGQYFSEAVPARMMRKVGAILTSAHSSGIAHVPHIDASTRLFLGPLIIHVVLDGLLRVNSSPSAPSKERLRQLVDQFMTSIPDTEDGSA